MPQFSDFDTRQYRTVDARTGYAEWVNSYERTVENEMDIALLDRLTAPDWSILQTAADLGCGTGRTGVWLQEKGITDIDGVDLTPQMLELARAKGVYRQLTEANVAETGLASAAYDLVTTSLVDEHLADVGPLYREAWRVANAAGWYVVVGFHPQFIMVSGMPTHYTNAAGEEVAIDTHVHLLSDHVAAALGAGWRLAEMHERIIDDAWIALKPKWARFRGHPVSFVFAWQKPA